MKGKSFYHLNSKAVVHSGFIKYDTQNRTNEFAKLVLNAKYVEVCLKMWRTNIQGESNINFFIKWYLHKSIC